ncbi:unnamed protein product [Ectocarpus fasciculatus]
MEVLLCCCMTWAPRRDHYRLLRSIHHRLLLRAIGHQRKGHLPVSLLRSDPEEVRVPERGSHYSATAHAVRGSIGKAAGRATPEMAEVRRTGVGGENPYKGYPEQNWLTCLKDDFKVFRCRHGSTDDKPYMFGVPKLVWTRSSEGEAGCTMAYGGTAGS